MHDSKRIAFDGYSSKVKPKILIWEFDDALSAAQRHSKTWRNCSVINLGLLMFDSLRYGVWRIILEYEEHTDPTRLEHWTRGDT